MDLDYPKKIWPKTWYLTQFMITGETLEKIEDILQKNGRK